MGIPKSLGKSFRFWGAPNPSGNPRGFVDSGILLWRSLVPECGRHSCKWRHLWCTPVSTISVYREHTLAPWYVLLSVQNEVLLGDYSPTKVSSLVQEACTRYPIWHMLSGAESVFREHVLVHASVHVFWVQKRGTFERLLPWLRGWLCD